MKRCGAISLYQPTLIPLASLISNDPRAVLRLTQRAINHFILNNPELMGSAVGQHIGLFWTQLLICCCLSSRIPFENGTIHVKDITGHVALQYLLWGSPKLRPLLPIVRDQVLCYNEKSVIWCLNPLNSFSSGPPCICAALTLRYSMRSWTTLNAKY